MNYDAWLERPYQEAYDRGDAFVAWCEREGVDPDDADAQGRFEDALETAAEEAAEERAIRRAEAREDGDW